jgi:hypothetical protein
VGTAQERRNAGHRDWNIATSSILSSLYKKALPAAEVFADAVSDDFAGVWQSELHEPESLQWIEREELSPPLPSGV